MFSRHTLWRIAQASQLLPRPLAPVRSKIAALGDPVASGELEEERAVEAQEGSDIPNVRPMEEMVRGDGAHSNAEQTF